MQEGKYLVLGEIIGLVARCELAREKILGSRSSITLGVLYDGLGL